jgi:hypothetical protein
MSEIIDDKVKIKSISLKPDMILAMEKTAEKLNINFSGLVRLLAQKYLPLLDSYEKEIPILIKIPVELKSNPDKLKEFLDERFKIILEKLTC